MGMGLDLKPMGIWILPFPLVWVASICPPRVFVCKLFIRKNALYYDHKKCIRPRIIGSLRSYSSLWTVFASSLVFHSNIWGLLYVSLNGRILLAPNVLHRASFTRLT